MRVLESLPVHIFHDSVNLGRLTPHNDCLAKERGRAPGRGTYRDSFIIDALLFVHSFTAQLPRGMQVQRNPPAQQLQCL